MGEAAGAIDATGRGEEGGLGLAQVARDPVETDARQPHDQLLFPILGRDQHDLLLRGHDHARRLGEAPVGGNVKRPVQVPCCELGHVAARVDDNGLSGGLVADQVGRLRQAVEVVLGETHAVLRARRSLGDDSFLNPRGIVARVKGPNTDRLGDLHVQTGASPHRVEVGSVVS